jgi:GNAT superfamily N-acetyltransferase
MMDVDADARQWRKVMNTAGRQDLACVAGGRLVGYATINPDRATADPSIGELSAIYLQPDAWGRGWGASLWHAAVGLLRQAGHRRVAVWVLEANQRARRFYERLGMCAEGRRTITVGGAEHIELRYGITLVADAPSSPPT